MTNKASDDAMAAALKIIRHYADLFCEGGETDLGCGKYRDDDCSGCKARTFLTTQGADQ